MNKTIIVINGSGGCVDCDTEFFNGYEWKKIADYKEGDKILQYNEDGMATLCNPIQYHKYSSDYLWEFKNNHLDMCFSEEHNMYYITSKGHLYHKSFQDVKKAQDNKKNGFTGKFITHFNYSGNGIDLSDDEIKLMCAVICDGSFSAHSTNYCYMNIKKERKKEEIRSVLKKLNYEWKERTYDYMEGYTRFIFYPPRKEKIFGAYWYNCNNHQLKIICDNIMQWDGYSHTDGNTVTNTFSANNKKNADFIQFVFSSCGYPAIIITRDRRGKQTIFNNKTYIRKSIDYNVSISKTKYFSMTNKDKKKNINKYKTKDGYKYCFTTETGMWVMRRNNKILITGNSGKDSFVNLVKKYNNNYVMNYSSVNKVKTIAKLIGWNGEKTERDRRFLSDLKLITSKYNDMPYKDMSEVINIFKQNSCNFLFLHIREPQEIQRLVNDFGAKTLLITSDRVKQIESNMADANVLNFEYDYVIDNSGTFEDLEDKAIKFIKEMNEHK